MSVLSYQSIRARCSSVGGLIEPFELENCKSAGYDLTAGGAYYLAHDCDKTGEVKTGRLAPDRGPLEIGRNQVALIAISERLNVPKDLVGHVSLKMNLLLKGVIMASQSQIDAGYTGHLTILLYNLSDRAVTVHFHDSIVRVEFITLDKETESAYKGKFQDRGLVIDDPISSSLSNMDNRVEGAIAEVQRIGHRDLVGGIALAVAFVVAILTAILVVITLYGPVQKEASDAQAAVTESSSQLQQELTKAQTVEATLKKELAKANREAKHTTTQAQKTSIQLNQQLQAILANLNIASWLTPTGLIHPTGSVR
jgi:deoxycytidine triphosphate deaminase